MDFPAFLYGLTERLEMKPSPFDAALLPPLELEDPLKLEILLEEALPRL